MSGGFTFKRCTCPTTLNADGKPIACRKRHGSWYFAAEVRTGDGSRRQERRGGFATQAQAQEALSEFVAARNSGRLADDRNLSVEQFFQQWLARKVANGLRATTARSYGQHIDDYVVPVIGRLRLRDVRPAHVDEVLAAAARPKEKGKTPGPATIRRIHATMRSAFATAKKQRYLAFNPAVDLELPKSTRPVVQPWEPEELGAFLDHTAGDPLSALYEVAAFTGLRRGELLGLRWADLDLTRARLTVRQQVVQVGHAIHVGPIKTASGQDRVVDLDEATVGALLNHRLRQDRRRAECGVAWVETGHVFTREDGSLLHPEIVTKRFRELIDEAGLRPIRLHDLRHGQASLMLAAGVPIAVVSKRLGHSSITITSDTYSHLLGGVGHDAANAAAALVHRDARRTQNEPNEAREASSATPENDLGPSVMRRSDEGVVAGHAAGARSEDQAPLAVGLWAFG